MTDPNATLPPRNRSMDRGWLTRGWDWIDERQIDKHGVSLVVLYGTVTITRWAMSFGESSARPGLEIAAIIAAVTTPYSLLQAAAIAFYFKARN